MNPSDPVPQWQRTHHARVDPHGRGSSLSEIILGGQDGVVAVLGALLGVAAASASARLVLAAGVATAFADAVSMAAVAYTSMLAQADVYRSEWEREYRHIRPSTSRGRPRCVSAAPRSSGTGALTSMRAAVTGCSNARSCACRASRFLSDHVHPNATGSQVIASLVWDTMVASCIAQ